jgi:hypothetical protein
LWLSSVSRLDWQLAEAAMTVLTIREREPVVLEERNPAVKVVQAVAMLVVATMLAVAERTLEGPVAMDLMAEMEVDRRWEPVCRARGRDARSALSQTARLRAMNSWLMMFRCSTYASGIAAWMSLTVLQVVESLSLISLHRGQPLQHVSETVARKLAQRQFVLRSPAMPSATAALMENAQQSARKRPNTASPPITNVSWAAVKTRHVWKGVSPRIQRLKQRQLRSLPAIPAHAMTIAAVFSPVRRNRVASAC